MNDIPAEGPSKKIVGRPWQKGQSGNPGGRPKGKVNLTRIILEMLEQPDADGVTYAEHLCKAFVILASKGNATIIRELFERIDGPVLQRVMLEDNGLFDVIAGISKNVPPPRPKKSKEDLDAKVQEALDEE